MKIDEQHHPESAVMHQFVHGTRLGLVKGIAVGAGRSVGGSYKDYRISARKPACCVSRATLGRVGLQQADDVAGRIGEHGYRDRIRNLDNL